MIAPEVGGGFGVKFGCYPEDVTLAALARLHRMPLRWVESRVEHMTGTTHGRAQMTDLEAAVEADGTHHRAPHARDRRHRRLPDLHVHPRSHPDDGRRRLPREERGSQVHLRVHQHHVGGGLPRRRAARRPPTTSSGWSTASRRARASRRRRSGGATSSRRAPSPTRRPPARTTTAASTTAR